MSQEFKLCKQAGLNVKIEFGCTDANGDHWHVVDACDVEKMLELAPVVYGRKNFGGYQATSEPDDTHTARLVLIQPIVRDTAESLLREFVRRGVCNEADFHDIYKRARALLGKGE